jgi:cyclin B
VHHLALYLAELSLVDIKMLAYPVSQISAACLHLALLACGHADSYPYALRKHARYSVADILPCARHLVALWQRSGTSNLKAVHKKFCSSKFSQVAQHQVVAIPSLPEATAV